MPRNKLFKDYRHISRLLDSGTIMTAFDTETTGLIPVSGHVIEIGAVKFDKNGVLAAYNTLVNPGCSISAEITRISHIDDSMVADSPCIKSVLPGFLEFIGDSMLIAHNANFDLNFINTELQRSSMNLLKNRAIDTLELSRWAYPTLTKHTLQFLAQAFCIDVHNAHRASDDARVCMEVFLRCLKDTAGVQKV